MIHHFYLPTILLSALLGGAIFSSIDTKIKPVESIKLSLNKMFLYALFFCIFGVFYAFIKSRFHPSWYSVYEIIIITLFGIFMGGFRTQKNSIDPKRAKPNEGMCRSLKYTVITF